MCSYTCICCDFTAYTKQTFKEHLGFSEHLKKEILLISQLDESFYCDVCCDFKTDCKKTYKKHIESNEHLLNENSMLRNLCKDDHIRETTFNCVNCCLQNIYHNIPPCYRLSRVYYEVRNRNTFYPKINYEYQNTTCEACSQNNNIYQFSNVHKVVKDYINAVNKEKGSHIPPLVDTDTVIEDAHHSNVLISTKLVQQFIESNQRLNNEVQEVKKKHEEVNNQTIRNEVIHTVVTQKEQKKEKNITKQSIPLALKRNVWNKHIGENIGKHLCLCCKLTDITQMNFSCGHIISEHNGGELKLNNLKPICVSCNSSMGTNNMDEFIQDCGL